MSRRSLPRRLSGALLLAGVLILALGLYYLVVRAGIPYQDPSPETQLRYAVNQGVGEALVKLGAIPTAIGLLMKLLFRSKK